MKKMNFPGLLILFLSHFCFASADLDQLFKKKSQIDWDHLDSKKFLSISNWMKKQQVQLPEWRSQLENGHKAELVGKILKCHGNCQVYRGRQSARVQHLSRLVEGDEMKTLNDSIAWIYLMDGTLVKVSPMSSLSFLEINISDQKVFFLLRLNYGHIHWDHRSEKEEILENFPETDVLSLPLKLKRANVESFERDLFRNQSSVERVSSLFEAEDRAKKEQVLFLNQLKKENNSHFSHDSRVMLVTPNMNLFSENRSFDLVYLFSEHCYLKIQSSDVDDDAGEVKIQQENNLDSVFVTFRGYQDKTEILKQRDQWMIMSPDGKNLENDVETPKFLSFIDFLSKRAMTLDLARELWLKEFTLPFLGQEHFSEKSLNQNGYALWGEYLYIREKFLSEYTRRIETTHLVSVLQNPDSGHIVKKNLEDLSLYADFFQEGLLAYYEKLKNRYGRNRMKIKEFSDLEYHIWSQKEGLSLSN